jgi:hypothetical protein
VREMVALHAPVMVRVGLGNGVLSTEIGVW